AKSSTGRRMTHLSSLDWRLVSLLRLGFDPVYFKTMKLLIIFFSMALGSPLYAQQMTADVLRFALFDRVPFVWKEGSQTKGFHYKIAQGISTITGRPLEITMVPCRRAIELLKTGKVDVIILTDQTELEDQRFQKAFLDIVQTLIVTMKAHTPILSKEGVRGRIARINGGCSELTEGTELTLINVKSYEQALDMLQAGRVDGICGTVAIHHFLHQRQKLKTQTESHPIQKKALSLHALKSMDKKKWKALEDAAATLVANGSIAKWALKYVDSNKP
ncbi:MAG: substrate-binding periplasmic protein, partial [Pseudobdellovibrionaceae bacterium]